MSDSPTVTWTKELPTEPGAYWLFGWRWKSDKVNGPAKMHFVTAHQTMNSLAFVCGNEMLYPVEGLEGMWTPADIPEAPKVERHLYRGLKVILKSTSVVHVVDDIDFEKGKVKTRPAQKATVGLSHWRTFDEYSFIEESTTHG